jgi:predicted transcriptional regulator of viral defense system
MGRLAAHQHRDLARDEGALGAAKGEGAFRPLDHRIADLAVKQHGVVALDQLCAFGLGKDAVRKRVAAGRLHRVHRGVYAVGYPLLSKKGHWMAAVLACGPGAVLSHRSAAALWGLQGDGRAKVDVTAPGRRGRMPAGIAAHRHGALDAPDRAKVNDIPCTSLARTLLDVAAVSPHLVGGAVAQAEVLRVFDLAAVQDVLSRSRRRRGVARLRRALSAYDPRWERTRSGLERDFLALCARSKLPPPEVNAFLIIDGHRLEPDFLWRDARLIVETDGRQFHDTPSAFERDHQRELRLTLAGWRVSHYSWHQVLDRPDEVTRALRVLLGRSRRS